MTKTVIRGWIKAGVLHLINRKRLESEIKQFPDCDIELTIKRRGKRSTQANRYYWGCIIEEVRLGLKERGTIAQPEEIHEALKLKFNPVKTIDEETGELLL